MDITSGLRGIIVLLWAVTIALFALAVYRASRGRKVQALTITTAVVAGLAGIITAANMGLVFIEAHNRGVVISAVSDEGYRSEALEPGLHWVVPVFEYVREYPISKQTYTMSILDVDGMGEDSVAARTADGQEIFVDASVIYQVDPQKIIDVHITWQDRYTDELVRPQARGIIRDAVSQFGVEEVLTTRRFDLVEQIRKDMTSKLESNGLILVDFVLRNITFSPEYAASVEQKQIAEQLAQQASFVVEQRRQEAEQARQVAEGQADAAVIAAQGEAESLIINTEAQAEARLIQAGAEAEALGMIAEAIEGKDELLLYNYISQISPNIRVMMVPSDNPFLLTMPAMETEPILSEPASPLPE